MPNSHVIATLAVTIGVFYLYTRPRVPMALTSLLLLLALLVIFYVAPFTGAAGAISEVDVLKAFGHPALVAICSLMILGRGLTMTGALEPAVRLLGRVWQLNARLGLLLTLVIAGLASGFVNDTPVLVLMLPMLLSLAERTGVSASKTLMPVNFAILAGGMLTSIGTSTNLLVLSIAGDLGMKPMGLFDFTSTAALSFLVALPYLWLVAPRLLSVTSTGAGATARTFEAQVHVPAGDALVGKPISALNWRLGRPAPVAEVLRGERTLEPTEAGALRAGDVLALVDTPAGLREFAAATRLPLFDRDGLAEFVESEAARVDLLLAEAVLGNDCPLAGRSLRQLRFAEAYRVAVVGIKQGTEDVQRERAEVADLLLMPGYILLIQGREKHVAGLKEIPDLLLLDSRVQLHRTPLARRALVVMAVTLLAASTKVLPLHVAAFAGMIAMILTGCVKLRGVGTALSLDVVLLVASSIALGQSLVSTGAAAWVAHGVAGVVGVVTPAVQLGVFMTFAAVLTNFVSNSAAAAVGTPIAVATAVELGSPLEPFVLAVLFGANLSYATPMAYQTNLLVLNAGRYRFADFLRVGLPLVALMLATLSILLARRYGL